MKNRGAKGVRTPHSLLGPSEASRREVVHCTQSMKLGVGTPLGLLVPSSTTCKHGAAGSLRQQHGAARRALLLPAPPLLLPLPPPPPPPPLHYVSTPACS